MVGRSKTLRLYGAADEHASLDWAWVERQLVEAGTYWVVACSDGPPHPRPVWGVWHGERLWLSVGSPTLRRHLHEHRAATVHLDSGTDVVIVEGIVQDAGSDEGVAAYDTKYSWSYDVAAYGPLTVVAPVKVMAWRTAGRAGRDGFRTTGCWTVER